MGIFTMTIIGATSNAYKDNCSDYYSELEDGNLGEVELLDLSKKEKETKTIAKRIKEIERAKERIRKNML